MKNKRKFDIDTNKTSTILPEYAATRQSLEDALEIRRRILLAFERAERETDEANCQALLNFAIVGGGPMGVELAV